MLNSGKEAVYSLDTFVDYQGDMRGFLISLACLVAPVCAHAATANVQVLGLDGQPLAGAVVMIDAPRKPAGPIKFPWAYAMGQRKIMFDPHVLIVPVGASVAFPNFDKVRHHVYSFSKAKKFDLKLYGKDETRSVVFDQPGVVSLGCNIHDQMSGFIIVVNTPYATVTDAKGRVTIDGVPSGNITVRLWHPSIRTNGNTQSEKAIVAASGVTIAYSLHR